MIFTQILKVMRGIIFVFLVIIVVSCAKTEPPETVIKKAIEKLENANTFSYDVSSVSKTAYEKDTIQQKSCFEFKKVEYEPYLKAHFTMVRDTLKAYYKTAELFTVNDEEKKITQHNFRDNETLIKVVKWGGNQESLVAVEKALKEFQKDNTFTFMGEEKINGKTTYHFTATTKKNMENRINYFWFDTKTYDLIKLKTIQTVLKNRDVDYTFYICHFENIQYNKEISDGAFSPGRDGSYETIVMDYIAPEPGTPTFLEAGRKAPEWILEDINGNKVKSSYEDKYTFIECWKSDCEPCINSVKGLDELIEKYGTVVNFISINFDRENTQTKHAIDIYKIKYPVLRSNEKFAEDYKIQALPTRFLIDKEGKVLYSTFSTINNRKKEIDSVFRELK